MEPDGACQRPVLATWLADGRTPSPTPSFPAGVLPPIPSADRIPSADHASGTPVALSPWHHGCHPHLPCTYPAQTPPIPVRIWQGLFQPPEAAGGYITMDAVREMMSMEGSHRLSEEECSELIRLADPEGIGKIPFERFKTLPCWKAGIAWDQGSGASQIT